MCHFETHTTLCLAVSVGGIVFTFISIICSLTNSRTDSSLRCILISFSLANMAGCCMFTYDTVANVCAHSSGSADFLVIITMSLSLFHLMLLTMNYYIIQKNTKRQPLDNLGLILTAWITSAALGSMTSQQTSKYQPYIKITLIFIFILCIIYTICRFVVIRKHKKRSEKLKIWYRENFLRTNGGRKQTNDKSQWRSLFLAGVLYTYALCFIPWVVNEMRDVFRGDHSAYSLPHTFTVLIYIINFYVPSGICMYTSYYTCRLKRRGKETVDQRERCETPEITPLI